MFRHYSKETREYNNKCPTQDANKDQNRLLTSLQDHGQPCSNEAEAAEGNYTIKFVLRIVGKGAVVHWSTEEKGSGNHQGSGLEGRV